MSHCKVVSQGYWQFYISESDANCNIHNCGGLGLVTRASMYELLLEIDIQRASSVAGTLENQSALISHTRFCIFERCKFFFTIVSWSNFAGQFKMWTVCDEIGQSRVFPYSNLNSS